MLDIKLMREQPDLVIKGLSNRGVEDAAAAISEIFTEVGRETAPFW